MQDDDKPAAILAEWYSWRPALGRGRLQLVFEVPLEQQGDVLKYLGQPSTSGRIVTVGIAITEVQNDAPISPSKRRYKEADPKEQARVRSVALCKDTNFWLFLEARCAEQGKDVAIIDEEGAGIVLRDLLGIESRNDIARDEEAYQRFLQMETDWKIDNHFLPEPR